MATTPSPLATSTRNTVNRKSVIKFNTVLIFKLEHVPISMSHLLLFLLIGKSSPMKPKTTLSIIGTVFNA